MLDRAASGEIVIAPTFNNARTLPAVLDGIDRIRLPVIVVDDGSTDSTGDILRNWENDPAGRIVIRHEQNQGKAAAMMTAFERAREMGFSHAVTIDTDGQLDPAEIPDLFRVSRRHPRAIVVGCRAWRAPGYPLANRLARMATNLLVRWECGARLLDSQCGFRVYPLAEIRSLPCHGERYGLETEILTRAAWAGVPIKQCRVGCSYRVPEGRVSHYRPWRDSWACAKMHFMLMMLWPIMRRRKARTTRSRIGKFLWWISPIRAGRSIRDNPRERERFAAGLAVGVFVANLPIYGFQTLLGLFIARRMRLNPLPVIVGSYISTPPIGPVLIAVAIGLGHWFIHGDIPNLKMFDPSKLGYVAMLRSVLLEWCLGSVVCGAACAGITYGLTRLLLQRVPARKPKSPADHQGPPDAARDRLVAESRV